MFRTARWYFIEFDSIPCHEFVFTLSISTWETFHHDILEILKHVSYPNG